MRGVAQPKLSGPMLRTRHRGRRVVILLLGVAVLGIGDLVATATHMSGVGLVEANPVARHLVIAESTEGLILFKLGSLGLGIGLLVRVRRHAAAELGSWVMILAMALLTLHWHYYSLMLEQELQHVTDLGSFARHMRLAAASQ